MTLVNQETKETKRALEKHIYVYKQKKKMKRRFYRESRTNTKPVLLGFYFLLCNKELPPKTETSHHHGWKESNFAAALGITTSESTDSVYICCTSGMEIRHIAYRPRLFPFYPLVLFPPYVICWWKPISRGEIPHQRSEKASFKYYYSPMKLLNVSRLVFSFFGFREITRPQPKITVP